MVLFPDDPFFPEDDARRALKRIVSRLRRCVKDGFAAHLAACAAVEVLGPALDYLGTRAHFINALVVEMIRREFPPGERGLHTTDENGFFELQVITKGIDVQVDLRFKLVDESGRSRNADTGNQWFYRNQLSLSGDGDTARIARLTVGWRWNVAATDLKDIVIVYAKGDEPVWQYSILAEDGQDDGPGSLPIPTPKGGGSGDGTKYASKSKKGKDAQGSA